MSAGVAVSICTPMIALSCWAWVLIYLLWGGTAQGKDWYSRIAQKMVDDSKGGVPLLVLAIPILLAGTVGSLLMRLHSVPKWNRFTQSQMTTTSSWSSTLHAFCVRMTSSFAPLNAQHAALLFLVVPLVIYTISSVHRHWLADEDDANATPTIFFNNKRVKECANVLGVTALVALCLLLIPVARHSIFLQSLGWGSGDLLALHLHVWGGRIVVIGGTAHGLTHVLRWLFILKESLATVLVPPRPCWRMLVRTAATTTNDETMSTTCANPETECNCYSLWRNWTGLMAFACLTTLSIFSLHVIRRKFYAIFYQVHMLAGPLLLIMVAVHWNRSILYLCGGILYYLACSVPVWIENRIKAVSGTTVAAVEAIPSPLPGSRERICLSLTLAASEAAVQIWRPGMFVRLSAPELSRFSHPFTVVAVRNDAEPKIRILFRVNGRFTQQLAARLLDTSNRPLPKLVVDGYYGTQPDRLAQLLHHDAILLVAGGIGITPYLALLTALVEEEANVADGNNVLLRHVVLHWMCRDEALVAHVKHEYLETLIQRHQRHQRQQQRRQHVRIEIIVHNSGGVDKRTLDDLRIKPSYSDVESRQDDSDAQTRRTVTAKRVFDTTLTGMPFISTKFASGSTQFIISNLPLFLSFCLTGLGGLGITWYCYTKVQSTDRILSRLWVVLLLALLSAGVSIVLQQLCARDMSISCGVNNNAEWQVIRNKADESDESLDESDQTNCRDSENGDGTKNHLGLSEDHHRPFIRVKECFGRPSLPEMFRILERATHPAVFVCGPARLVQGIRAVASDRCLLRFQRCDTTQPRMAVYEESFEL